MTRVLALLVVVATSLSSACASVQRPIHPSAPMAPGDAVAGLRFEPEETTLREPGFPVAADLVWKREVESYAARSLNTLLQTEEAAPIARTVVAMEQGFPPAIELISWRTMAITLTTTLPNGEIVRSAPVTGDVDTTLERLLVNGLAGAGTVLYAGTVLSGLALYIAPSPLTGILFFSLLGAGIFAQVGGGVADAFVARVEEARWSDLYALALRRHAEDLRARARKGGFAPRLAPPTPLSLPPSSSPPGAPLPSGAAPPTPAGIDPADGPSAAPLLPPTPPSQSPSSAPPSEPR